MDKSKASQNAIGKEKQMLFTPFIGTGMNFMGGGGGLGTGFGNDKSENMLGKLKKSAKIFPLVNYNLLSKETLNFLPYVKFIRLLFQLQ